MNAKIKKIKKKNFLKKLHISIKICLKEDHV